MENTTDDLDQKDVLKEATEKSDKICLDSVNMGILIPTENDYQESGAMAAEVVKNNQILSDKIQIENKLNSPEKIIYDRTLDKSASMINVFAMKSENLPSIINECDEILPDIKLEINENLSKMDDDTLSLENIEKTTSTNDELLSHLYSQKSSSSMILDSNYVESIQSDSVEMNSLSNVKILDIRNSSMLDEDALLDEDSSPNPGNAAINEISSQMDDENALLNEDEMDDGNAEQIDEDALLNDEESVLIEGSTQKINEILSEIDENKLLNEDSSSQTDVKSTDSDENLLEMDEHILLNEGSPQITSPQVNESVESSETLSLIGANASLSAAPSCDDESLLIDDRMLYIPVTESLRPITESLKADGMLCIPQVESLQKKKQLGISTSLNVLRTPVKIRSSNNCVNKCVGSESMDSRETSEEGEIVTGDSLIISGESKFPNELEIKQERIEECEQLTINEQAYLDNCGDNMNSEDMLDTGQKCDEANGVLIKEECLERIEEESQEYSNLEIEENTIFPQIASCESLQNKQDNVLSSSIDSDIFQTVIKEECVEYDRVETLEANIKDEITDMEECIDAFDQSIIKQEVGYSDEDLQHIDDDLNVNTVNDTDFSVVPVSLKSNSEFHNGNLPNSMEEEIIIPSSVTTNLRPRRCKKVRSKECNASNDKSNSELHLQDMDEEVDDLLAPRGFACPICDKKYINIVTLTRHEKTHEEIDFNDPKNGGVIVKDGTYLCSCGKGFRRRSSALACIKVHKITGLPCQWCSMLFQTQMTLRKHCKEAHRKMMQTKHHCTTCKRTFTHKRGLLRHTQMHLRELKKEMKSKKNKSRPKDVEVINLDSEDSLDKPQLSCDFCNIDYKSVADLRSHLICAHPVIHSASELDLAKRKPFSKFKFICRTCGKGHSTLGALTLHNKTEHKKVTLHNKTEHKKVKVTFNCDRCHERFPTRSELSSHRRLHCRGVAILPPAPSPPAAPTPPPPPPMNPLHQCDVCELGFMSQGSMEQHRETHPFLTFLNTNTKIFFK